MSSVVEVIHRLTVSTLDCFKLLKLLFYYLFIYFALQLVMTCNSLST